MSSESFSYFFTTTNSTAIIQFIEFMTKHFVVSLRCTVALFLAINSMYSMIAALNDCKAIVVASSASNRKRKNVILFWDREAFEVAEFTVGMLLTAGEIFAPKTCLSTTHDDDVHIVVVATPAETPRWCK